MGLADKSSRPLLMTMINCMVLRSFMICQEIWSVREFTAVIKNLEFGKPMSTGL